MPTLSSADEARRFSDAGCHQGKVVPVHLKVDTGMGRLGCAPASALCLAFEMRAMPGLRLEGLLTHYASVEDDARFSTAQKNKFEEVINTLSAAGFEIPTIHANNSGAILLEPKSMYNLVRPGLLVYGIIPPGLRTKSLTPPLALRPALSLKCRVGWVKEVRRGTAVSYGHAFIAPRKMRLATLTAGYGDGYFRSGSDRAQVLVGGRRCHVVGRITMDQTIVDISALDQVRVGDEVVLIGEQGKDRITATELAEWCGTIPWEVLTNITYRVPRLYRGGQAA
jgi:alanine racemase